MPNASVSPRFTMRQLKYFLAVAEAPTISAAAERLNISQGAVTEALDELERQLSAALFVRRRAHGVTITTIGRALIGQARAVLSAAEDLQSLAAGKGERLAGQVVIGCYPTLAPFLAPKLVSEFERLHPEVDLKVFEGAGDEIAARLHDGQCDLALLPDYDLPEGTSWDLLYSLKARVVLPAAHPLAAGRDVRLRDLADEPLIQFEVEPALSNTRQILRDVGVTPRLGRRARSVELVRSLVGRGLGYAILLHHPPGDISYEGRPLAVRPIRGLSKGTNMVLARSERIRASGRSEVLRAFCLASLRAPPQHLKLRRIRARRRES